MDRVIVHPRVTQWHPSITEEDVLHAWNQAVRISWRGISAPDQYVAVGIDRRNRLIEMVAAETEAGDWMIYHAMTPPSMRTYLELGIRWI